MANELLHDRHFRLRRVGQQEHKRVQRFALDASASSVPPRPLHTLLGRLINEPDSVDLEGLYVIEDVNEQYDIIGAAATVLHAGGYVEICGATILRQGFGLQAVLTQVRTHHADGMAADQQFFCVVPRSDPQLCQRMIGLGFEDWSSPAPAVIEAAGCSIGDHHYLLLSSAGAIAHAKAVCDRGRICELPHTRMAGTVATLETDVMTVL